MKLLLYQDIVIRITGQTGPERKLLPEVNPFSAENGFERLGEKLSRSPDVYYTAEFSQKSMAGITCEQDCSIA